MHTNKIRGFHRDIRGADAMIVLYAGHWCVPQQPHCRARAMSETVERRTRDRAVRTWPAIVGFAVGCGLGARCETAIGLRSLALPAGLALLAVAMGMTANLEGVQD